jgi:hypothetical protein
MVTRSSTASSIWPHLPQTNVEPPAPRRNISPLARQPQPPEPPPRLTRSRLGIGQMLIPNGRVSSAW